MVNTVILVGRLVREPEMKKTTSGISYTRFTVAINRNTKEKITDFIPVVAWRSAADFIAQYVKKGFLVSVEGYLSSYTSKNEMNETSTRYEVVANQVKLLEKKKSNDSFGSKNNKSLVDEDVTFVQSETTNISKHNEEETEDDAIPWDIEL